MDIEEALYIKSLILKDLQGSINQKEKQELDEWTNACPENQRMGEQLNGQKFIQEIVTDESELMQRQWEKLSARTINHRRNLWPLLFKYAAAVMIPAAIITGIWLYQPDKPTIIAAIPQADLSVAYIRLANGSVIPIRKDSTTMTRTTELTIRNTRDSLLITSSGQESREIRWNKIIIPRGMDYIVQLEDGTSVHLNAESVLEIPDHFSRTERRIRLSGGAYFNVRHENNRPFFVEAGNSSIKVLGTQFDIRAYADHPEMLTTLIQGSVEVTHNTKRVILKPGLQASINANGEIGLKEVNTLRYTAWRDRRLIFDNEYLTDIINEINHWYDYDFIITDPDIRKLRLTMNIERFDNFTDFQQAMEKIEKIRFRIDGKVVKITKQ